MKTKAEMVKLLSEAMSAPCEVKPSFGCGRAYVCLSSKVERKEVNAFSAACKELDLLFLRKAYGAGNNALYVGYDNADGKALSRADLVAKKLREAGVPCYCDAVGD